MTHHSSRLQSLPNLLQDGELRKTSAFQSFSKLFLFKILWPRRWESASDLRKRPSPTVPTWEPRHPLKVEKLGSDTISEAAASAQTAANGSRRLWSLADAAPLPLPHPSAKLLVPASTQSAQSRALMRQTATGPNGKGDLPLAIWPQMRLCHYSEDPGRRSAPHAE